MKRNEGMETMRNEFTAIIERDENWYIAFCPEIPGANGQGKTQAEARGSLAEAIALILEDRLRADVGTASGGFAVSEEGSWTRRIAKYFEKRKFLKTHIYCGSNANLLLFVRTLQTTNVNLGG